MISPLPLMPLPHQLVRKRGALGPGKGEVRWRGATTPRLESAVARLDVRWPLHVNCGAVSAALPALDDDESYRLVVEEAGVWLDAPEEWGVLRGLATLAQLAGDAVLPHLVIDDAPRYPWRGLLLDVARHFIPATALRRTLDAMALCKLNVLHLHLTDDQGFRFESTTFPRLAQAGGPDGFFTQAELAALVAYAAGLGIRVVPEIDVPGHSTSWLAAHPEWGVGAAPVAPSRRFGVHENALDVTNVAVIAALDTLLGEVVQVFPDRYLHIGGDEVHPAVWKALGVDDPGAAHAAFNAELAARLAALDRVVVGWDEVLHDSLPKGSVVQCWRGAASRDRALDAGFDCVFSAPYYLDLFYPADIHYQFDPGADSETLTEVERTMREDPRLAHVRAGLDWAMGFAGRTEPVTPAAQRGRLLGGEACLWSELVTEPLLDVRLWTRLPVVAERLWRRDAADAMYLRLAATQARLEVVTQVDLCPAWSLLGLTDGDVALLGPLFGALEPAKWYARLLGPAALAARLAGREAPAERPYDADTPLNRAADVLPPESPAARAFAAEVRVFLKEGDATRLLAIAQGWRAQAAAFQSVAARAAGIGELAGWSERLGGLADVVDRTVQGEVVDGAVLDGLGEPEADLVLAVFPALCELVGRG